MAAPRFGRAWSRAGRLDSWAGSGDGWAQPALAGERRWGDRSITRPVDRWTATESAEIVWIRGRLPDRLYPQRLANNPAAPSASDPSQMATLRGPIRSVTKKLILT